MSKKATVAFMQKVAGVMMKGIKNLAEKMEELGASIAKMETRLALLEQNTLGQPSTPTMKVPVAAPQQPAYSPPPSQSQPAIPQQPAPVTPQQAPPAATPPLRAAPPRAAPPNAAAPGQPATAPPPRPTMSLQQEMLQELKSLFGK
ncbi:MAG: hypothetical protein ACTSUV_01580 [Candidatus Ranarchaeia archaeon]